MEWWGRLVGFGWAAGLSVLCFAAAGPGSTAGIDAIRAYEGTWKVTIDHLDTAERKASHEENTLRNDCWKSGAYFACNQYVEGDSKVLLVFTYNATKNEYTSYQIPQGGGQPGSGRLLIEGNVWTFPWQIGEGDKTRYFRVVNTFVGSGKIEFRQEFSDDGVHWTVTARGVETKSIGK